MPVTIVLGIIGALGYRDGLISRRPLQARGKRAHTIGSVSYVKDRYFTSTLTILENQK